MPTAAKKATARGANPTEAVSHLADVTDRMHGLLMDRADALMDCLEGSAEEAELAMLTDIIEAYERREICFVKTAVRDAQNKSAAVSSLPRVAVLLPCLNEALAIGGVIAEFRKALPDADIYVIDNGSHDATAQVARLGGAEVIHELQAGKGNAVRRAFAAVEADVYLLADGDGTYEASRAPELIDKLLTQRLDMVVATRSKASDDAYRWGHQYGNNLFNLILKRSFGSTFEDVFSGYRVLSRRYIRSFPALSQGFEIETEMAVHAILLRMPTLEVATQYGSRVPGTSSKLSTWRDGARVLATVVRLIRLHRPLIFFSSIAGLFMAAAVTLFYPVLVIYLETGLVPRFPTLIVSLALLVIAIVLLACGLVLDAVKHTQLEIRRLLYLNAGDRRDKK